MSLQIYRPFGPSIMKVKIPEKILNDINDYVDKIIEDKEKNNKLDYGNQLAGDVTQELKLEPEFATKIGWVNFLAQATQKWIELEMKTKITEFKIINSWIVRQFKNEYNPVHWHGGHISGAGFLKVPSTFGTHLQDNKNDAHYKGGTLNLIHGTRQFLSSSIFSIKPEVGDFYFFPNYLMHAVYPFKGTDEERRSISFNAFIDKKIQNVYARG